MEGLVNAASSFMNQGGGQQGSGGSGPGGFDIGSLQSLIGAATNHSQQQGSQQDASLFSQVASRIQTQHQNGNIQPQDDDPDDDQLMNQHEQVVNGNQEVGTGQIGNAAALGAIKSFLGGSGNNAGAGQSSQSAMIGMAMSQAAHLFDQKQSQGLAQGNKSDAMEQAGQMVMKLMLKNQASGMIGGGQSGGLSALASKFL